MTWWCPTCGQALLPPPEDIADAAASGEADDGRSALVIPDLSAAPTMLLAMEPERPEPHLVAESDQLKSTLVSMGTVFGAYFKSLLANGLNRDEALSMLMSCQGAWLVEYFDPEID